MCRALTLIRSECLTSQCFPFMSLGSATLSQSSARRFQNTKINYSMWGLYNSFMHQRLRFHLSISRSSCCRTKTQKRGLQILIIKGKQVCWEEGWSIFRNQGLPLVKFIERLQKLQKDYRNIKQDYQLILFLRNSSLIYLIMKSISISCNTGCK